RGARKGDHELFRDICRIPSNERLSPELRRRLTAVLEEAKAALAVSGGLEFRPHGRYRLHVRSLATLGDNGVDLEPLVRLWLYRALRQSEQGKGRAALRSALAAWNAARSVGDEPLHHSQ